MEKDVKKILAVIIFIILAIVAFLLVKPFIGAVLFAAILAYILHPLHKKLNKIIKNPNISASLITFVFIAIIAILLWLVAQIAIKEAFSLYLQIQKLDIYNAINNFLSNILADSPELSREVALAIQQTISQAINTFMNQAGTIITNAPVLFLQVFVSFFVAFYFLRDGEKIMNFIHSILPFEQNIRDRFLKRSNEIAKATIYGQVIVGVIQGATAGIGFYIFGAPSPLFFSILAVFAAILPFIGPAFVWVPISLIMLLSGNMNGLYLFIFGIIVVSWIDNVIKPHIVGKKGKLNPIVALIGMLGGLALIGPIGLVVGPLVFEYILIFISIYRKKELEI